ncbi:MAG: GAF domain-containing protein [Gemmatimonadota bacterium]
MPVDDAGHMEERREALLRVLAYAAEQFLRSSDWRTGIDDVLARLGAAADVSRVHVFENRPGDEELYAVHRHEWLAQGVASDAGRFEVGGRPYGARGLNRWRDALSRGELIGGPVGRLPGPERELLEEHGIRSVLVVPIFAGDDWWGTFGFDDIRHDREWDANEHELLRAAAGILGAAIQRSRATELARLNQERLSLAMDGTDQGLWDWDIPADTIFFDERWTSILGYHRGEVMPSFDGWEALVHPEDLEQVATALGSNLSGVTTVYSAE